MPCNVYGPGDHFEFKRSPVVSALVRRFVEGRRLNARVLALWGTGSARRELLRVDDLSDARLFLLQHYDLPDIVSIGSGEDITIRELAEAVARIVGHVGELEWDRAKPVGTPQKLLDVSRLRALGWRQTVEREEGIQIAVDDLD